MTTLRVLKSREKSLPTAEYINVTPEMATEWLDTIELKRQRKFNMRTGMKYAEILRRGDWMVSNDAVTFDEAERLTNGQHRLWAIVHSDVPAVLLVVRNITGRAQLVMDQGLKRKAHEQVALRQGWEVTPLHMSIAKSMICGPGGIGEKQRREISTDIQLLDRFYMKHHLVIEWTVEQFVHHQTIRGVTIAPVMAPVARAFYSKSKEKLARFAEVVSTGMADRPGESPAVVLRNYLIAGREKSLSSRAGKDRYTLYKKTEIALNAYLKGESIERLGQRNIETELFPIPNDVVIKKGEEEEG